MGDLSTNPPIVYNPTQYYGTTADFLTATGTRSPSAFAHVLDRNNKPPRVYNASFGIQRDIGFGTVLDVAYVGSFGRHIGQTTDINMLPYGTRFLASSADPSQPGKPLTDDFLRPYQGYASTKWLAFDGNSSYHSLQVQAQRRFSRRLQFGVAYTFSKAMDYSDGDQGTVSTYVSRREFDYGEATYDRTHVLSINYQYALPNLSGRVHSLVVKKVFDDWKLNGITRFQSGAPLSMGTLGTGNLDSSLDLTGGAMAGARWWWATRIFRRTSVRSMSTSIRPRLRRREWAARFPRPSRACSAFWPSAIRRARLGAVPESTTSISRSSRTSASARE
jgi:hypothetical protein